MLFRSCYDAGRGIRLFDNLGRRVAAIPGVQAVAMTQTPLLANVNWDFGVTVPGYVRPEGQNAPNVSNVSAGYFSALGIPMVSGREFRASDDMGAPRVAVINQTFGQTYFGNANPIERVFYFTSDTAKTPIEIVGVVTDSKYSDIQEERQRFIFCPYAQRYDPRVGGGMTIYARTGQDPESVAPVLRQVVREADPNLPIFDVKTMQRQIEEDIFAHRIVSLLSVFFGVVATLLAAIGLYGVMSYTVARRTREIGIRMALGAKQGSVLGMILREVAILAAIGIAVAAPLAFPLASLAKSMLFGVAPHDLGILAGAAAVLALTALAAGYIPAARAARVDPLVALRND